MANNIGRPADLAPPGLPLLAREIALFAYMRIRATFAPAVKTKIVGKGETVVVIPGFMASDRTTARLRRSLDKAGFVSAGWGLGRNQGIHVNTLQQFDDRLSEITDSQSVILIGWSLGGLIAREYAKYAPHRISKVITLGSPFSGHRRANNVWRLYEMVAGHSVDDTPIPVLLHEKPPVPTTTFWSRNDGVVAHQSARGNERESDKQIELSCQHMAFIADTKAIQAVIDEIANSVN